MPHNSKKNRLLIFALLLLPPSNLLSNCFFHIDDIFRNNRESTKSVRPNLLFSTLVFYFIRRYDRQTERQTDKQSGRLTGRHTNTDRQTARRTEDWQTDIIKGRCSGPSGLKNNPNFRITLSCWAYIFYNVIMSFKITIFINSLVKLLYMHKNIFQVKCLEVLRAF